MKPMKTSLAVALAAALISGCASGVHRQQADVDSTRVTFSKEQRLSSVSISLTEEAGKKLQDNLKFDPDTLKEHVERALRASSLINPDDKAHLPSIEIVVTDMRTRSNFSAVMFGFMAGADSITGNIVIKDESGNKLDEFKVSASYALGGLAGGQDSSRMGWLYEEFAKLTVKELKGQGNKNKMVTKK